MKAALRQVHTWLSGKCEDAVAITCAVFTWLAAFVSTSCFPVGVSCLSTDSASTCGINVKVMVCHDADTTLEAMQWSPLEKSACLLARKVLVYTLPSSLLQITKTACVYRTSLANDIMDLWAVIAVFQS